MCTCTEHPAWARFCAWGSTHPIDCFNPAVLCCCHLRSGIKEPMVFPTIAHLILLMFLHDRYNYHCFKKSRNKKKLMLYSHKLYIKGRACGPSSCRGPSCNSRCCIARTFRRPFLTLTSVSAYWPCTSRPLLCSTIAIVMTPVTF